VRGKTKQTCTRSGRKKKKKKACSEAGRKRVQGEKKCAQDDQKEGGLAAVLRAIEDRDGVKENKEEKDRDRGGGGGADLDRPLWGTGRGKGGKGGYNLTPVEAKESAWEPGAGEGKKRSSGEGGPLLERPRAIPLSI